jgi:hypothetical protein
MAFKSNKQRKGFFSVLSKVNGETYGWNTKYKTAQSAVKAAKIQEAYIDRGGRQGTIYIAHRKGKTQKIYKFWYPYKMIVLGKIKWRR